MLISAESSTLNSYATSDAPEQEHGRSGVEEGGCGGDGRIEVFGKTAITAKPSAASLDYPAARMHGEAHLAERLTDDLDGDAGCLCDTLGGIGRVCEGVLDEGKATP